MALKKVSLRCTVLSPDGSERRLDQILSEALPVELGQPISKAKIRKLIVAGAVYLNGKRIRIASKPIRKGARIEAWIDLERLLADSTSRDRAFEVSSEDVLFEDQDWIAINKPPGLPMAATLDDARDHLFAATRRYLEKREGKPGCYVGLHHRLDRDTSGVTLFTKREGANAMTSLLFSEHQIQKTYLALVDLGDPTANLEAQWKTTNYLGKSPRSKKQNRYTAVRSGGNFAETEFRLLERWKRVALVEARPKTGRTHQIRVHLSEAGLPIVGDPTYGSSTGGYRAPRLMLHAAALTFRHPVTNLQISIQSPLPKDFDSCLQALRAAQVDSSGGRAF